MTSVGYGNIAQQLFRPNNRPYSMIMGYGITAMPIGIYSVELIKSNNACANCGETGHDFDVAFCKCCDHSLDS